MISINAYYGTGTNVPLTVAEGTTIGQIKANRSLIANLGCGSSVDVQINGVTQGDNVTVRDGDHLVFVAVAQQKAA